MSVFIKSIVLNELDGLLQQTINFTNGLNIISGENGTGKTTVIKKIKDLSGSNSPQIFLEFDGEPSVPVNQLSIFALSPKRNSEKQAIRQTFDKLRTQSKTIDALFSEIKNKSINDSTFDSYASLGELFGLYFDLKSKDGGDQIEKMNLVTTEFNEVLQLVFPEYKIISTWDNIIGKPDVRLKVKTLDPVSLEKLSCGQQEVLSLLFNIYVTREGNQIYLIDEPEIHLNWDLEKGLFKFFNWFCDKYKKQIIITTHSRVIFNDPFYQKTKFLVWDNNKIICQNDISEAQRVSIIGELAATVQVIAPTSKTIFVEDKQHEFIIGQIAGRLQKDIVIVQAGNCGNVTSLFKLSKNKTSAWRDNGYYMIDGDNQGNPFPGEGRFIKLSRYSIESYLFNLNVLSNVLAKPASDIQSEILEVIKSKKEEIFKKGGKNAKFGEQLLEKISVSDITEDFLKIFDCSQIMDEFAKKQGKTVNEIISVYIKQAQEDGKLAEIFDASLMAVINS